MNNQEFFDGAVAHLRKQGQPAVNPKPESYPRCAYRLEIGGKVLACAVGGLIPDDVMVRVMDLGLNGSGARRLVEACPEAAQLFDGVSVYLMVAMQMVHDDYPVGAWERLFEKVAFDYDLDYAPPAGTVQLQGAPA